MSTKFFYSETIPAEVLPAIKDKLSKYESLIPGWVQEVRVYWNGASSGDKVISGEASGDVAYRWARIVLCPAFLDETQSDREDTAIHELTHIILAPLTNFYAQILHYLDDQPDKVRDFIDAQMSERVEGVTVDLTTALLKTIRGAAVDQDKVISGNLPAKKGEVPTFECQSKLK